MKSIHPRTILVIEDSEAMCNFLKQVLKGYEVVTFNQGLDAMSWLYNTTNPDLIISDLRMPEIGGMELLKNLQSSGLYRHIPVIILSGWFTEATKTECIELGAFDYVEKPFNPNALIDVIERAFESVKQGQYV